MNIFNFLFFQIMRKFDSFNQTFKMENFHENESNLFEKEKNNFVC